MVRKASYLDWNDFTILEATSLFLYGEKSQPSKTEDRIRSQADITIRTSFFKNIRIE